MIRVLLFALCLIPSFSFGAAYDIGIDQRPPANNVWERRLLVSPATTGVLAYNPTTLLPVWLTLGNGLQALSGVLSSTVPPGVPADWAAANGPSAILNKPTLAPVATLGTFAALTGVPATFPPSEHTQAWSTLTSTPTTLAGYGIADAASLTQLATKFNNPSGTVSQYLRGDGSLGTLAAVATAGTFASLTGLPTTLAGYGITDAASLTQLATKFTTPAGTTAQYVRGDGSLATLPVTPTPTPASATRALNTAFQPNATRPVLASYTVDISVVSLLLSGTQGTVTLQYADNSTMTTNLVTVLSATNSTGGVLNVSNIGTATLTGFIPAGKYVRLVTANTSGSPTFTFRNGQETVF